MGHVQFSLNLPFLLPWGRNRVPFPVPVIAAFGPGLLRFELSGNAEFTASKSTSAALAGIAK